MCFVCEPSVVITVCGFVPGGFVWLLIGYVFVYLLNVLFV